MLLTAGLWSLKQQKHTSLPVLVTMETTDQVGLTCVDSRRLQLVAGQLTPAHRVQVGRLAVHPLVVLVFPAVEVYP